MFSLCAREAGMTDYSPSEQQHSCDSVNCKQEFSQQDGQRASGTVQLHRSPQTSYHRAGTVFFSLPPWQEPLTTLAIFFPGDNVEGAFSAEVDRLSRPDTIASLLQDKLGHGTGVLVIYPSRYEGPFACYDNLFPSSDHSHAMGSFKGPGSMLRLTASGEPLGFQPEGLPSTKALLGTLKAAWPESRRKPSLKSQASEGEAASHAVCGAKVVLCGFSKGGVVLNQLFAELVEARRERHRNAGATRGISGTELARRDGKVVEKDIFDTPESFLSLVSEMHYIDVGLQCRGAYPTDPALVSQFVSLASGKWSGSGSQGVQRIFLHGTPRQWKDRRRPWIGQEQSVFFELLKSSGAQGRKWLVENAGDEAVPVPEGAQCSSPAPDGDASGGHVNPPPIEGLLAWRTSTSGGKGDHAAGPSGYQPLTLSGPSCTEESSLVVDEILYFHSHRPSMNMHFDVLDALVMHRAEKKRTM